MRLDQLTDGLNSTEPSVVCTTLRKFRQEVYLAYADDTEEKRDHDLKAVDETSYSRLLMFRKGLVPPRLCFWIFAMHLQKWWSCLQFGTLALKSFA